MTKLKPCPFCGGEAYIERGRVECSNPVCGASVGFSIPGKEREAWNNRTLEGYLIELLKKALETLSKIKLRANEERSMCGVTFDFAFEIEELADELIDEFKRRGVLK